MKVRDQVLQAIADAGGRTYAPDIRRRLAEKTGQALTYATIYAALDLLAERGKVKSEMGLVDYPERGYRRRRYYEIIRNE